MKKRMQKWIILLLSVVLVVGVLPMVASAKPIDGFRLNDLVEFGRYPQSRVTEDDLVSQLNAEAPSWDEWTSYGYSRGTGIWNDGQMIPGDFMRYVDVSLDDAKYRGVMFTAYRPDHIGFPSSADNSEQDDNGYNINTTYWFRYDPLYWRVLNPADGLVLSETVIDTQAYTNYLLRSDAVKADNYAYFGDADKTYYANDYAKSSIRAWLNEDFYNTAFSTDQQDVIERTKLNNKAHLYSAQDSASTNDKIFLLSWDDACNTDYGFDSSNEFGDIARRAQGSDYAKCQGLSFSSSDSDKGNCAWWLRTPGNMSDLSCMVVDDGHAIYYNFIDGAAIGVRPALRLNLQYVGLEGHGSVSFEDPVNYNEKTSTTDEQPDSDEEAQRVIVVILVSLFLISTGLVLYMAHQEKQKKN